MVIKFDHISYSASMCEEENVRQRFDGYKLIFEERELDNLDIKAGYFGSWHDKHNILMLGAEGQYPVELTLYDACVGTNNVYSLKDEEIIFRSANINESKRFFGMFDFSGEGDKLSVKPMLDAGPVILRLEEIADKAGEDKVLLDKAGFGSLALVVDSIDRYAAGIKEAGYIITDTKRLMVNGKMLKIAFASGKCNEIVELIGVR